MSRLLFWRTPVVTPTPPTPPTPPTTDPGDPITEELAPAEYEMWVCRRSGTKIAELTTGIPQEAEYTRGGRPGAWRALIHRSDPGLTSLLRPDGLPGVGNPEIHWYRDGLTYPCWQGWAQEWDLDPVSGWWTVQGWDPLGHLPLMVFGDAQRVNYAADRWSIGWWSGLNCTLAASPGQTVRDDGTAGLAITSTAANSRAFQRLTPPVGTIRQPYYISVWVKVPAGTRWGKGLRVVRYEDGVATHMLQADLPDLDDPAAYDEWVPLEVGPMGVNPGTGTELEVQLFGSPDIGDVIYTHDLHLCRNDNNGVAAGSDAAQAVSEGIRAASEKGSLGLRRSVTLVGETLSDGYKWEHQNKPVTAQATSDFEELVDIRFDHRTRTVEIGADLGDVVTGLTIDETYIDSLKVSGAEMRTVWQSIGDRGGVTGEESGSEDQGDIIPGYPVEWETVERAPQGLSLKDLDRRPGKMLDAVNQPAVTIVARLPVPEDWRTPADWLGLGLKPSDLAALDIDALTDPFEVGAQVRLASLKLQPTQSPDLVATWEQV